MEMQTSYYIRKIKEDLSQRQRKNPHYSLRAYAQYLGVHPATLSQIISDKRPLPLKNLNKVIEKLNLPPKERSLFMESVLKCKIKLDKIKIEDEDTSKEKIIK